jgi:hypothetical protein
LPMITATLCPALAQSATQYRRIRSLIHTAVQTYRTLPLIPNPTSAFLAEHANGDVQKTVVQWHVIGSAKYWFAPALTLIAVESERQPTDRRKHHG